MNGLSLLMEILNGSGEIKHLDPIGDRHVVVAFWDGSRMLIEVAAAE